MNTKKSFKEKVRVMQMARSKSIIDLLKKIEKLEKEDRAHFAQLILLEEQGQNFQSQLKDYTAQKIQLELEITYLKNALVDKIIKLEPCSSASTTDFEEIREKIQHKKHLLENIKEKLAAIQKEDDHRSARTLRSEKEKIENIQNLAKLRTDLASFDGNSGSGTPSSISNQLKALIREQRIRITKSAILERKLAHINYGYELKDIQRKREALLNALKEYSG